MTTPILTSVHGVRLGLAHDGGLVCNGQRVSGAALSALSPWAMGDAPAPSDMEPGRYTSFFDDCLTIGGLASFTAVNDGGTGTNVFLDQAGGVYGIVTAAADNDYHALASNGEHWLFAAGKPLWFETRTRVAEGATDGSTWWVGFTDTVTTGGMQANAAGPLADYDGALFYKTPEATMTLNFETSNATVQVTSAAIATSVSNTWTKCGMYFDGVASIYPFTDVGAGWVAHTAHTVAPATLAEMHLVLGIKALSAAETLQVDYVKVVQAR